MAGRLPGTPHPSGRRPGARGPATRTAKTGAARLCPPDPARPAVDHPVVPDWRNFVLLVSQPFIIAALVSWVSDDRALIMFFAYLATMWFGCSNAAQEIVKEIAIYRRERLVGVGAHSYLASKFIFLIGLTMIQATLLYITVMVGEGKAEGSVKLQLAALYGIAIAGVGIGAAISALSRSVMQAVMFVPLIPHPADSFFRYNGGLERHEPQRAFRQAASRPTFCAQTVMDTSFLWQRELSGDLISDHHQSYRNLDPNREFSTGDIYNKSAPPSAACSAVSCGACSLTSWRGLR
ncbi:MAG: ABC transporter permease [Chthoniobacter sp.]